MTRHESLPELLEAVPNTEGRQSSYEEMRGFQMSARVLAAATPVLKAMDSGGSAYQIAYTALNAADAVMFSEAAIERAAIQVFALNFDPVTWSWKSHENDRQSCRNLVRAVVAALREGA